MIRQYFKLTKAASGAMLADFQADTELPVKQRADMVDEFKKDFHADGSTVYRRESLGNRYVVGYEVMESDRIPRWAKRESFYDGGANKCYYWKPKLNFKRGKEFNEWLKKINAITIPSFSNYVVEKAIGDQPFIIFGMARHYAVAGMNNDTVVLSVPTNEENPVTMIGNWDFKLIKKSEYVAITEE